jgi:hypothetical protein
MPADRAFFDEHGWLVVRKAVPPYPLARLQVAFEDLLPPQPESEPTVFQVLDVSRYDDACLYWMHACAGPLVAEVLGCQGVRLLQDTLALKPARTGGTVAWHQDYSYMAYLEGARAAAVRVALTEETVENGCMHVVDGSHTWGLASSLRTLVGSKIIDDLPADRAAGKILPIELEPGDMAVHHTFTFHGSFENRSHRPRKSLIAHTFDAASKLDRQHVPRAERIRFPTDEVGRLVGPTFPLIFGR